MIRKVKVGNQPCRGYIKTRLRDCPYKPKMATFWENVNQCTEKIIVFHIVFFLFILIYLFSFIYHLPFTILLSVFEKIEIMKWIQTVIPTAAQGDQIVWYYLLKENLFRKIFKGGILIRQRIVLQMFCFISYI